LIVYIAKKKMSTTRIITYSIFWISLFVAYLPKSGGIAVMSVDLGSEWLKIGIVKPGVPMEIALNMESKRKTPFVVSMNGDERLFGDPAMNVAIKKPSKAYIYLTHIIGKKYDSAAVEQYKKRFPFYTLLKDEERGTVLFAGENNVNYSVEELVAMVLNNSKHIAENFASHKMKDVVLTVPAYFTQSQRRSLLVSANMTGLNVLQLINDNTAVALNYGIFRSATFNSSVKHVMFFDMGATHTTVTIVGYSTTKVKDRGYVETVPQLVVKGVGFDAQLGGLEMDLRLRDHLVKGFKEKYSSLKSDITLNQRSMAKLLKEARRLRQVLSPNTDHFAQIENLFEEKDFKMKVSRSKLEELCADLFERVSKPIKMAFDASSMTKDNIDTVVLMGGGTRIPRVQEILSNYLDKKELGKSINTDEAAALGAVYKAASLMIGFKVKRFIVKDLNMYPVDVQFVRSTDSGDAPRQINRNLYHRLNPLPQKKIMTFNKKVTDFNFNISYGDLTFFSEDVRDNLIGSTQFASVKLTGVESAHLKNTNGNAKGVKAFYHLDESGLLNIEKVEAHFEKTPEVMKEDESTLSKIGSKISDFFGSLKKEEPEVKAAEDDTADKSGEKSQKEEEKTEKKTDDKDSGDAKKDSSGKVNNETVSSTGNDTAKENATEKVKPKENVIITENIQFDMESVDIPSMSTKTFDASVIKLKALEARDQLKKAVEMARNSLESFISEGREKLEQEEVQTLSSTSEREKIEKDLTEVYNWFDEDGYDADEGTLKKKLKMLKESTRELTARMYEASERPKAISGMLQSLNMSTMFTESMLSMPDAKEIYTDKDIKDLNKVLSETKTWFMNTWKKQNESDPAKNPVLLVKDIQSHQGKLDREMMYLINKAKYYVPKPKPKNDTTDAKTEKKSGTNSTTDAKTEKKTETNNTTDAKPEKSTESESKASDNTTKSQGDDVKQDSPASKEKEGEKTIEIKASDSTEHKKTDNVEVNEDTSKSGSANTDDTSAKELPNDNKETSKKHNPEDEL